MMRMHATWHVIMGPDATAGSLMMPLHAPYSTSSPPGMCHVGIPGGQKICGKNREVVGMFPEKRYLNIKNNKYLVVGEEVGKGGTAEGEG